MVKSLINIDFGFLEGPLKGIGTFILAQSDKGRAKHLKHLTGVKTIEAFGIFCKEIAINHAELIANQKASVLEETDPHKRWRMQKDLNELERDMSFIEIMINAKQYMIEYSLRKPADGSEKQDPAAWYDEFIGFARRRNEPWRQDLLSKAMAQKALDPKSISLKTLWVIGNLEKDIFHLFADFLNIAVYIVKEYMIPSEFDLSSLNKERVTGSVLQGANTYGGIITALQDEALIANVDKHWNLKGTNPVVVRYCESGYWVTIKHNWIIQGIFLTPVGKELSLLYQPQRQPIGEKIWEKVIDKIGNPERFELLPIGSQ
jgi:hypothetical protein